MSVTSPLCHSLFIHFRSLPYVREGVYFSWHQTVKALFLFYLKCYNTTVSYHMGRTVVQRWRSPGGRLVGSARAWLVLRCRCVVWDEHGFCPTTILFQPLARRRPVLNAIKQKNQYVVWGVTYKFLTKPILSWKYKSTYQRVIFFHRREVFPGYLCMSPKR